jgi:hypothetical protein
MSSQNSAGVKINGHAETLIEGAAFLVIAAKVLILAWVTLRETKGVMMWSWELGKTDFAENERSLVPSEICGWM